LRKLKAK
jgi:hypothetical protein